MAKLLGDGVLIVWVDLKDEARSAADRWYEQEHLPERITHAGYLRARRFAAVRAAPAYMAVFEADTPAGLASEGYSRITSRINPRSHAIRAAFTRCIRSTHRRLASFGDAEAGVMVCSRLRFTGEVQRAAFEAWAPLHFQPWVQGHEAVLAGHALAGAPEVRQRMDSFRETGQADEWADAVLLLELGQEADADAALLRMLSLDGLAAAGVQAAEIDTGTYRCMLGFTAGAATSHTSQEKTCAA